MNIHILHVDGREDCVNRITHLKVFECLRFIDTCIIAKKFGRHAELLGTGECVEEQGAIAKKRFLINICYVSIKAKT